MRGWRGLLSQPLSICRRPEMSAEIWILGTSLAGNNWSSFFFFQFFRVRWDWVQLVRRPLIGQLYQP
jgi:hypothetical protein